MSALGVRWGPPTIVRCRVAVGFGVVVAVAVGACSSGTEEREAALIWAEVDDPQTLMLTVGACNARTNRASVDETAEAVTITVVTDAPAEGDSCADGVTVVLDAPLGARELIDGSTRQVVEVHVR